MESSGQSEMVDKAPALPSPDNALPAIVVLAAGRSTRFAGGNKLVQPLGGSTVLCTTIANALASQLPVVVVTTADLLESACGCVARRDVVLVSDRAEAGLSVGPPGMGRSIAAGVAARPHAGGWLVLPGDMPLVRTPTMQAVARGLAQSPVAFAQHRGRRGHPVAFGAELFSELVTLQGDVGARRLIAGYPGHGVETADSGVLMDIDTEDDLAEAAALFDSVFGNAL